MSYRRLKIGEICRLVRGTSPTLKTLPGPYPLVVTAEFRRTADSWQIEGPAVCVPLISSTGHGDAALHRVHYQDGKFALANLLVALLPNNPEVCYAKYLFHLLMARKDDLFVPLMLGTANVSLKERDIAEVEIPLPPLAEQRRIVARIEELAAQIHEARALRQQAAAEADALIDRARSRAFEKAAANGTEALTEVATLERGKFSHRPRNDPRFFGGDHPWIQIGEIEAGGKHIRKWNVTLNDEGLAISKKFPKGTVLVSIAATIGAVGILDFDCCVPDSIVGVTPKAGVDSEFLYHYLAYIRSHLESIAPQSAQKNINLQILSPLPVPRLSNAEQRRIVAELDTLQAEVDTLKRHQRDTAAELDALLPAILDRAFRGEL